MKLKFYLNFGPGNVVMHYKRYAKDPWLPNSQDPSTYLSEEDKYGILIFKVQKLRPIQSKNNISQKTQARI